MANGTIIFNSSILPVNAAESISITIEEAIQLALKHHYAIEQASWQREQAAAQLSNARRQAALKFHGAVALIILAANLTHNAGINMIKHYIKCCSTKN